MIIALDLETTGLDEKNDEIIEIALVKFDKKDFSIVKKLNFLVKPQNSIPELITKITGITSEDLKNAKAFEEIKEEIEYFIEDSILLGHNIDFDIRFLKKYGIDLSNNISIDTLSLANFLFLDSSSLKLENLITDLGIESKVSHRALEDTLSTIKLFSLEIEQIKDFSYIQKQFLKYIAFKGDDLALKVILDNFIDKIDNIDSTIFTKEILKLFPTFKEKEKNTIKKQSLKVDNILDSLDFLEKRKNQIKMLYQVKDSLEENKKIVIEAPTGVGKTFAYLIPSIAYSLNTQKQVFISTSTKALQDQIVFKDLEFLKQNLEIDFSYSKLKGKSNYISILAFFNFFYKQDFFTKKELYFILKIVFWLFKTKDFELEELDFFPFEYNFVNEINADNPFIFSSKNPYLNREPIIVHRNKAKKSNIVIINNNILFQDLDQQGSILGKVEKLIIDEAHNLEDVITNSLKKSINFIDFQKKIESIKKILAKYNLKENNFLVSIDSLFFNIETLFGELENYLFGKVSKMSNFKRCLFKKDFYKNIEEIIDIKTLILSIMSSLLSLKDSLALVPDEVFIELSRELFYIDNFREVLNTILNVDKNEKFIVMLSFSETKKLSIEYTILNPGEYLKSLLWEKVDSCILTSATLTTNKSFDYITHILDLKDFDDFIMLDSDFDYKKQALMYIPDDLGSIKSNTGEVFEFIKRFLLIVGGKTLVLFTSIAIIRELYYYLFLDLTRQNIKIFAQGFIQSKHKIIDFFKINSKNSVIFGTDSFWEGIDISGEDLSYLIIHKIPFMVPDDPVFQARGELFKDSFYDYSIPKAVLKLKQGFGRLIRTKKDKGIIIFLDDRIYSTNWGSILKTSFPSGIKVKKGAGDNILNLLKNMKK